MKLFQSLEKLDLPIGQYVIVGGSLMARGIREERDLDVLVTPNLYKKLLKTPGYKQCTCETCMETSRLMLKGNDVDILPNFLFGSYTGDTNKLISNAENINGYPFIQLEEYIKFKTELYASIGKSKYLEDIKLMKKYLEQQRTTTH